MNLASGNYHLDIAKSPIKFDARRATYPRLRDSASVRTTQQSTEVLLHTGAYRVEAGPEL